MHECFFALGFPHSWSFHGLAKHPALPYDTVGEICACSSKLVTILLEFRLQSKLFSSAMKIIGFDKLISNKSLVKWT